MINRNKETLATWNKLASLYEEKFMHLDYYNESYDFICDSLLKENPKLLEIGCGPGNITKYLLSKRPDFNIYGIDNAPNMIDLAGKNNPSAKFDVMDCRLIHELTLKFDSIVCGFCIPYLSQPETEKFISDSSNLINEKGLIYISFVEGDPNQSEYKTGSNGSRVFFNFHNLEYLKALLINANFEELIVFHIDYPKSETEKDTHTIIVARKKSNL